MPGLIHARDAQGAPAVFVDLHQSPVQPHFALRYGERRGQVVDEPLHDRIDRAAENGMHRAAHPGVAEKRGAAGKNLFVRRLHVGVSAENRGDAAVEKTPDGDFLARGFPMRIDHDDRSLGPHFRHRAVEHGERILQDRLHEGAGLDVDHADFSLRRLENDRAAAGRAVRDN